MIIYEVYAETDNGRMKKVEWFWDDEKERAIKYAENISKKYKSVFAWAVETISFKFNEPITTVLEYIYKSEA